MASLLSLLFFFFLRRGLNAALGEMNQKVRSRNRGHTRKRRRNIGELTVGNEAIIKLQTTLSITSDALNGQRASNPAWLERGRRAAVAILKDVTK
ncbi:hypothetical protein BGZ63DRAFT_382403 [Mariannaea sp. PMI_226]|nr:hypothetical protein BGZ63DRAFT_382403 [Mariannaea sp. PMI_226]